MTQKAQPITRHVYTLVRALLIGALILLTECVVWNLPFWTTLSASTDSAAYENTLGSGLERVDSGFLKVVNPTSAYLQVEADGTSSFARIDALALPSDAKQGRILETIHLQVQNDSAMGETQSVSVTSPQSLYIRAHANSLLRVWVQEPIGSLIPIQDVRANAAVPFRFNWTRVALMTLLCLVLVALRPRSRLWDISLNTDNLVQRLIWSVSILALAAVTALRLFSQLNSGPAPVFHIAGSYTYDFNQYGHAADSLLAGHSWLNLPVPQTFADSANPYSPPLREQLLSQGVNPIYWDYAFFQGHWYSYFGVLPALVLFLPYRVITSLWIPGGAMLSTEAAISILIFGFAVSGSLLIIRMLRRLSARPSLAITLISLMLFFLGSNALYLLFRPNFYSIPFATSLLLSSLGLWFWFGASSPQKRRKRSNTGILPDVLSSGHTQLSTAHQPHSYDSEITIPYLSLPHLAAGALCIAANFASRPTFCVVALLAIPLFYRQIATLFSLWRAHSISTAQALRIPCAVIVPALVVILPFAAYNAIRFGSPLNFGNEFQITVADMTAYKTPASNLLPTLSCYTVLPLRFSTQFPFLMITPCALPQWGYTEAMVGGLFVLCPLLLLSFGVLFMRRKLVSSGLWPTLMSSLGLSVLLMVIDSIEGGLGWRYITDFAWLCALPSIGVLLAIHGEIRTDGNTPLNTSSSIRYQRVHYIVRGCVVFVCIVCIAINILALFVPGRDDALIKTNPKLFHDVASWFVMLR